LAKLELVDVGPI